MRLLATVLAALLYGLGWLAGVVSVALRWVWSAVQVGWDDAHRLAQPAGKPAEPRVVPPYPAPPARAA